MRLKYKYKIYRTEELYLLDVKSLKKINFYLNKYSKTKDINYINELNNLLHALRSIFNFDDEFFAITKKKYIDKKNYDLFNTHVVT